jgi:hypothetical protein
VASGDVLGSFDYIARLDRRLTAALVHSSAELLAAAAGNIEVIEMINFALGEELATRNRRLGVDWSEPCFKRSFTPSKCGGYLAAEHQLSACLSPQV